MTVANENMEWSITCDGATESATGVVLDAQLYDDDEIEVILKTIATGAEATLTKTSDYLVTGVPGATAVVKTTANYTSASAIYVRRTAILSQTDDIVTGDPFPSEVIETILDKDAMALQVINNKAARGMQVTKASGLTDLTVIPTASKIIGFNAAGTALMLYDTSTDSGDASLADLLSASGFGTIIYPQEVQVGSTGIRIISGTGSPEGVHTAKVGSVFLRTDGGANTTLYKKETGAGNTGWVNISAHDHTDAASGGVISGRVVQTAYTRDGTYSANNTAFPVDDTIPQNSDGIEFMTQAITPTSATNKLFIEATLNVATTVGTIQFGLALFQDSTANALAASVVDIDASGGSQVHVAYEMVAGTTSLTTFKLRGGPSGVQNVYFNGLPGSASRVFGGVSASYIRITELEA